MNCFKNRIPNRFVIYQGLLLFSLDSILPFTRNILSKIGHIKKFFATQKKIYHLMLSRHKVFGYPLAENKLLVLYSITRCRNVLINLINIVVSFNAGIIRHGRHARLSGGQG